MKNQEIDDKVKRAFTHAAPDVLDAVLTECRDQEGKVVIMAEKKKTYTWRKWAVGIAAAFVLVAGGAWGSQTYRANYAVDSIVALDVNPSIEITVNKKERVLAVEAKNEDAKQVIGDMDFEGSDLDVTLNALIGSMLKNGYLSEIANSILVSIDNSDPQKSAELQKRLTEEINKMLQTDTFSGAVLSQTMSSDAELQKLADKYGITLGKAQLIQKIIIKDTQHTFEDLVSLTINELNLLSESGSITLDNINSVGTASDKAYIGEAKAKETAIAHAGLTEQEIGNYTCKLDSEDGIIVYEIEFTGGGYEYDYEIHAVSGVVLKYDKETDESYVQNQPAQDNTVQPDNGGNANPTPDANQTPSTNPTPDLSQTPSTNPAPDAGQTPNTNPTPSQDQGNASNQDKTEIDEAQAKQIAFSHAGVSEGNITEYKCKKDTEDGIMVYEIEFDCNGYEYEYEIAASDGAVRKSEKEQDDDYVPQGQHHEQGHHGQGHYGLNADGAKEIAFTHAGVAAGDVSNCRAKWDEDDDATICEVEFCCGGYEYEYKIDVETGTVVDYEKERDD